MKDMEFDLTKPHCYYFNEIAKIPHGSKNEKRLSDWIVDFAKAHGLRYVQDDMYNVVIYKDATKGYEDHPGVIVQAHIDMVCEKTPESTHNFETDPLELYVEGTHLRAKGTTLGGDDCICWISFRMKSWNTRIWNAALPRRKRTACSARWRSSRNTSRPAA